MGDLNEAVSQERDLDTAPEHGLNGSLGVKMRELVAMYEDPMKTARLSVLAASTQPGDDQHEEEEADSECDGEEKEEKEEAQDKEWETEDSEDVEEPNAEETAAREADEDRLAQVAAEAKRKAEEEADRKAEEERLAREAAAAAKKAEEEAARKAGEDGRAEPAEVAEARPLSFCERWCCRSRRRNL